MRNKNVLTFGAHPDDVEFGCGGTLILLKELGYAINIVDLTKGEKSKFGANKRITEAKKATKVLGGSREILNLSDGSVSLSDLHQSLVSNVIKRYNPTIVFVPYFIDKHLDHVNTTRLVSKTFENTIHYFISDVKNPTHGVDITSIYPMKVKALYSHKSQIRTGDIEWSEKRNRYAGRMLDVDYGELFFIKNNNISLPNIFRKLGDS